MNDGVFHKRTVSEAEAELIALTRSAFVPKIVADIYKSNPLLDLLLAEAKSKPFTDWQSARGMLD